MIGMQNQIALRPSYWASVSGGKDSLYMLNLILHNLDRYPLDGVVHFELEIDYPFIHDVIDYMEEECKKHGIKFVRIKPRKTWEEWFYHECTLKSRDKSIYAFPTRKARWCNDKYKLDSKKQLEEWMKSLGYYVVHYIGYCVDEEKRYKNRHNDKIKSVYPLVDFGIEEDKIWRWAKTQPIFNHYYETQKRCGCMYCPMQSKLNWAYLYKYYPANFKYAIDKMRETENLRKEELGLPAFSVTSSNPKYNADYLEKIVKTKYLDILNQKENFEQMELEI